MVLRGEEVAGALLLPLLIPQVSGGEYASYLSVAGRWGIKQPKKHPWLALAGGGRACVRAGVRAGAGERAGGRARQLEGGGHVLEVEVRVRVRVRVRVKARVRARVRARARARARARIRVRVSFLEVDDDRGDVVAVVALKVAPAQRGLGDQKAAGIERGQPLG